MSTPAEFLPDTDWKTQSPDQRYAADAALYVQFHVKAVMNEHASKEAERMIFTDTLYIRIMVPGDKHSIVDRPATADDKKRFGRYLDAFKNGLEMEDQGTPLTVVPWLSPSQVEEYKYFNIYTVEQLAEVGDNVGQKFRQFNEHKRRATEFVQGMVPENVRVELNERDERIAELEAKLAELLEASTAEIEEA